MTRNDMRLLTEIADTAAELAELRQSAGEILRRAWSPAAFRGLLDGPSPAFDAGLWQTITGLGWPDVLVSEANGGGGGGVRELCVLAELAGAVAAPVPLPATAAANWCEDRSGDGISLLLPGRGERTGDRVSGVWPVVPFAAVATRLLVCAGAGDQTVLGVVDPTATGVVRQPVTPLDHNPAARIELRAVPIRALDEGEGAGRRFRDAILRAQVAQLAELVGIASAANDAATEYAKQRIAFGHPIGAYQAIKHRLVDQRCAIEIGRALVNRAADACEQGHPDAPALTSLAAFWGIDALRAVPEGATQVFGGIAYTWEHEAHVHLRRAASAVAALGARAQHRDAVTRWLSSRHPVAQNGERE
ncbi:acyl-CoA dehydrogenase [Mycobacterium intermedium]|uniref:Acyl-CoA dehydrogenase n=2 Tax=Mycobacterium intermedium TaxID=28445 RepID=A0A1E3SFK1_MYCIE|nr:acyl-CoA dehydrogenase family protein [Mycobacterium intermedium]ODR00911.1 acyl-CoA dehydrogenase [Mycobacterium intermedium]OPE52029.1 acyl-CoA dehydrogenase [Mycobacterium intermedium]ORB09804.1 acyl-CoA dehydrogenase [Mycobacterium intermedium]